MKKFESVAANEKNPKWEQMIKRPKPLIQKEGDIRTPFERDYTRIIYATAYRRMKHKTQVFFSPESDHICTRIEHVNYVESISYTIANALGLNAELTKAIASAHDIGHSPFGHQGERILNEMMDETNFQDTFGEVKHVSKEENGIIYVITPSPFIKNKINSIYSKTISDILSNLTTRKLKFKF